MERHPADLQPRLPPRRAGPARLRAGRPQCGARAAAPRSPAKLLDEGYALAASAFKTNGWDVLDAVAADEALHTFFVDKVGKPDRVYVWGDSLGGLITETLAEKHPEWVSGAAPLCGVLGGTNLNLDIALDVAYAVKTLIDPELKLTGFASNDEARRQLGGRLQGHHGRRG